METPDVIVVVLDCVRLQSLNWGRDRLRARTPNLDRLAAEGTVFDHAVAPANWTLPSHASMLTGLYPHEHGLTAVGSAPSALPPTVAQTLQGRGYRTGLFTEQTHLVHSPWLRRGYQTVESALPDPSTAAPSGRTAEPLLGGSPESFRLLCALLDRAPVAGLPLAAFIQWRRSRLKRQLSTPTIAHAAAQWMREQPASVPYHALINFVDAHEPYSFRAMFDGGVGVDELLSLLPASILLTVPGLRRAASADALRRGYVRGIEAADEKLGRVLDEIDRQSRQRESLVIVTSDHGQQFGEGGNLYHAGGATDAVARVPLLVRRPGGEGAGTIDHRWISLRSVHTWCVEGLGPGTDGADTHDAANRSPSFGVTRPTPIWCEASPAWEVSSSFRTADRGALWNRRLIAAYLGNERWTLDIASGRVWRARAGDTFGVEPGRLCSDEEAHLAGRELFPSTGASGRARSAPSPPARGTSPFGPTLASWGY